MIAIKQVIKKKLKSVFFMEIKYYFESSGLPPSDIFFHSKQFQNGSGFLLEGQFQYPRN